MAEQVRLIVNADDFGSSEEVNLAVIRAFREGILTSCSLMVTGDAFDHAVRLAREHEDLPVGIHLVSVMGRSVLPHREVPNIVDTDRNFSSNPTAAGLTYYFSKKARGQLRKELAAQLEKFHSTGLRLSHMDSHLHMHVHPVLFDAVLGLGEQYGARRMRVPDDELRLCRPFARDKWPLKILHAVVFRMLCQTMRRKLAERGFAFVQRVYGLLKTGQMSEEYVLHVLEHMKSGTREIYFHPAVFRRGQLLTPQQVQSSREFGILISKKVMERIQAMGIRLSNYFDLETAR